MSKDNREDDFDLPTVDADITSTGAAADSSEQDDPIKGLPRILRYAILFQRGAPALWQRLAAEIDEVCPALALNAAWMQARDEGLTVALALELDHRAVVEDKPELRSLADSVRLIALPLPQGLSDLEDHRRVSKALLTALRGLSSKTEIKLRADIEAVCFGWAAMPAATNLLSQGMRTSAAANAITLGKRMAIHRIAAAEQAIWDLVDQTKLDEQQRAGASTGISGKSGDNATGEVVIAAPGTVLVCTIDDKTLKHGKLMEIVRPLKHVINTGVPLVAAAPLQTVRRQLLFEFPYASAAIDFVLGDLVGRATSTLRPLLLIGEPGGGKSRFARRLAELLGLHCWRTDAGRSDGAIFGGTDKRWHTAEPCHSFLAIAQGRQANPVVLLDELEKAATRSDYGRLWDCLLGLLEPETSARYPDPALQTELDLSHVSYIATANSVDPLPTPLRDRFRTITFPTPKDGDLDALLPAVIVDIARERGLDTCWISPLGTRERHAIAKIWRGGSVRRLRRVVEIVLREKDANATRN